MSSAFEKIRIKVAAGRKNLIDLSHEHITTQDFGINKPIMCKEMVPGDSFDVSVGTFVRLAPMTLPTYGNVRMYIRGFFVPFRVLMNGFYEMLENTPYYQGASTVSPAVPTIANNIIFTYFTTVNNGMMYVSTDEGYDVKIVDSSARPRLLYFTERGRYFYDLLISLGYSVNWTSADTTAMSALPLLAFAKIYRDYFVPSQYQSTYDTILEGYFKLTGKTFSTTDIVVINRALDTIYQPDFFTSAYQSPNNPNSSNNSDTISNLIDSGGINNVNNNNNSTHIKGTINSSSNNVQISQFALELAQRLTSFIRRNAHVGTRWVDQSLARFGVRPSDAKMLRSEMLGSEVVNIQISDVMATASGTNGEGGISEVGDYAGKGIGYNNGHFHYESNEFGYFILISTIVPNVGYYQGRSSDVLRMTRLQFFTPEFDSIGMDPIYNQQLFADYTDNESYANGQSYGGNPTSIFGYCPRFSNYKYANDVVSGMFRVRSMKEGLDAYHLKRVLPEPSEDNVLTCGPEFSLMKDRHQYDRIFNTPGNVDTGGVDHFFTIYHFDIKAKRPMISVVDHLDVEGAGNTLDMAHYGTQV